MLAPNWIAVAALQDLVLSLTIAVGSRRGHHQKQNLQAANTLLSSVNDHVYSIVALSRARVHGSVSCIGLGPDGWSQERAKTIEMQSR